MGDLFSALVRRLRHRRHLLERGPLRGAARLLRPRGGRSLSGAGTLNISTEAMILAGAFAAAVGFDLTEHVTVGLMFAMVAGLLIAIVPRQPEPPPHGQHVRGGADPQHLGAGSGHLLEPESGAALEAGPRVRDSDPVGHPARRLGPVRAVVALLPRLPAGPGVVLAAVPHPLGAGGAGRGREPAGRRRVGHRREQAPTPGRVFERHHQRARRRLPPVGAGGDCSRSRLWAAGASSPSRP